MSELQTYSKINSFKTVDSLREYTASLGIQLEFDEPVKSGLDSPLAKPCDIFGKTCRNRFCIHPMEGWDGTLDGLPSEATHRRWSHFGQSGAALIWGCEAVAVRHDGRANPNQLMATEHCKVGLAKLRDTLLNAHRERYGGVEGLVVGVQLTHSGRFSRPDLGKGLQSKIAYHHPILDRRFPLGPGAELITDTWIDDLIGEFARAAKIVAELGFDFVDLKACHGYLGHEFLSARRRSGPYGGELNGRARFHRLLVEAVRREAPSLPLGVRLSMFDFVPFYPDPVRTSAKAKGPGVPDMEGIALPYDCGFGTDPDQPGAIYDLEEPIQLIRWLREWGVSAINLTAGSPYYNPHIQRPALFPPSDGYAPPEDPLVGVARQIMAARQLKATFPDLPMVGTAYTYLQEYLPHVAQAEVRNGRIDFVGIGRMVLSYPTFPDDVLQGRSLQTRMLCRTFSDCTTAPRNGMISGCYPLDEYYKRSSEAQRLRDIKRGT